MTSAPQGPARLLRRLILVKAGEGAILASATAYFFCLLAGYYLLRPVREAFGIARGADKLPWLMTGTLLAMLLVNPAFAALVSRFPRRQFIPWTYRFFALNLVAFFVLFRWQQGHGGTASAGPALGYAFYIWLSVFNLFVVSVFWGFLTDLFREEQAKRLFGFIAMGGTLGAVFGAGLTEVLSRGQVFGWRLPAVLDPGGLMLVSVLFLEMAAQCALDLARRFGLGDTAGAPKEPGPGAWEGLRLVAGSRYLQLMGGYMLLYTITSTFLYLAQGHIVEHAFASRAARTVAFARLDLWTNLLTLAGQIFLTGRVLRRFRMASILLVLPILTLLGFGGLWALPTFGMLALVQVSRRGLHYAVDRPAREILYIPLGPEEKYKSKPFLDTFVYRAGDLLGVWAPTALALVAIPAAPAAMALSAAWYGMAAWLGRWQRRMSQVAPGA